MEIFKLSLLLVQVILVVDSTGEKDKVMAGGRSLLALATRVKRHTMG